MTMEGCRGGDLVAPMSLRYLSIQPANPTLFASRAASREGRMDAMRGQRGHLQQEAQFQERPYERQDPVDGLWFHREQGPLRPLRAPPLPCDAMV